MSFFCFLAHAAHVPTYSGCEQNCCTPPHSHRTSQVFYLQGSGGLEIHGEGSAALFDVGEEIDFDAVFRDAVDPSTYALYVGCGGCMPSDPPPATRAVVRGYEEAELEPFTQTVHRSVFPEGERKFDAARLRSEECPSEHFTVRLVDFGNRSDGLPVVWAPVVGLGEAFTPVEILSFPLFILQNHGAAWTGLGWTAWLCLFLVSPALLYAWREMQRHCYGKTPLSSSAVWIAAGRQPAVFLRDVDPREALYDLSLLFFVASALEMGLHLLASQARAPVGSAFLLSSCLVILLPHGLGVLFVVYVWQQMHVSRAMARTWRPDQDGKTGQRATLLLALALVGCLATVSVLAAVYRTALLAVLLVLALLGCVGVLVFDACTASRIHDVREFAVEVGLKDHGSPFWWPAEVAVGCSFFFFLGAGFFGGPACIVLAGVLRSREVWGGGVQLRQRTYLDARAGGGPDWKVQCEAVPMGQPVDAHLPLVNLSA